MRESRPRRYLMCSPDHFDVTYAINAWMDTDKPVDRALALTQWQRLRRIYQSLGHRVEEIPAVEGLPDMVFAANGATVIDGQALVAAFRHDERAAEAPAYLKWFAERSVPARQARFINEGEGDFLTAGRYLLAGTGFRTELYAHDEAQEYFCRPVLGLQLVDPRFYHLDTALAVLDGEEIAYYPGAFSARSQALLRRTFPDALLADEADAVEFGLNAVSDGYHVVVPHTATGLMRALRERGFHPIGVDLSELRKAGGAAKCCTLELR